MATQTRIDFQWIHLQYEEKAAFSETYGFAGSQAVVNLEGMLIRPAGVPSQTLLIYMHPSSTLHLLPIPRAMAQAGAHVLCAASRYPKNDAALIIEKVVLDLGAYIRHAKDVLGYQKIVLVGWSGGGSLAVFYQSEAESPRITQTPAGDAIDLSAAGLIPADAVIFQSAHISRSRLLADLIDPSVMDELNPDDRDSELDIYDPANPHQPPYSPRYVARYRAAQLARVRRITATVKTTLAALKLKGTGEMERGFVVHRTAADLRYLDPALDPNGRRPRWCWLGNPETANSGPIGLARFCTLRSWLSQWSIDDSVADALCGVTRMSVPLLVIESGADEGVPQPHAGLVFAAARSSDKSMRRIDNATHYYAGQPAILTEAIELTVHWLRERQFG